MVAPALIPIAGALVSQFAPFLARKIGGDQAGEYAERILQIGGSIVGSKDPDEIYDKLLQDSKAAYQFQTRLMELNHEALKLEYNERSDIRQTDAADRKSAREMRKAKLATGQEDWIIVFLVVSIVAILVGLLLALFFIDFPENEAVENLLWVIVGVVLAKFGQIYDFFFGSSNGSKKKDNVLATTMQAIPKRLRIPPPKEPPLPPIAGPIGFIEDDEPKVANAPPGG